MSDVGAADGGAAVCDAAGRVVAATVTDGATGDTRGATVGGGGVAVAAGTPDVPVRAGGTTGADGDSVDLAGPALAGGADGGAGDRCAPSAGTVGAALRASARAGALPTSERASAPSAAAITAMPASVIAVRHIHRGGATWIGGIHRAANVAASSAAPAAPTVATATLSARSTAMTPMTAPNVAPRMPGRS